MATEQKGQDGQAGSGRSLALCQRVSPWGHWGALKVFQPGLGVHKVQFLVTRGPVVTGWGWREVERGGPGGKWRLVP